jgi:hypothetical protein
MTPLHDVEQWVFNPNTTTRWLGFAFVTMTWKDVCTLPRPQGPKAPKASEDVPCYGACGGGVEIPHEPNDLPSAHTLPLDPLFLRTDSSPLK